MDGFQRVICAASEVPNIYDKYLYKFVGMKGQVPIIERILNPDSTAYVEPPPEEPPADPPADPMDSSGM